MRRAAGAAMVGAATARTALHLLQRRPPGGGQRWVRTNYAGRPVTRLAGPAAAAGAAAGALASGAPRRLRTAVVIGATVGAVAGAYDDLYGDEQTRGLGGHLGALRASEVTTGTVKMASLGVTAATTALIVRPAARPADRALAAIVIAGTANLINLLDLRPGRALKAVLLTGGGLLAGPTAAPAAGVIGAGVAILPDDLGERVMLGDGGAGALGAALGVVLAAGSSRRALTLAALGVTALNLLSERVSFSAVISAVPALRALDEWGRH